MERIKMFNKIAIFLFISPALVSLSEAADCLKIKGACLFGTLCPNDWSCIEGVCCVTDPAANCDNVSNDTLCYAFADKCSDPQVGPQLRLQCPSTCSACTPAPVSLTTKPPTTTTTATTLVPCVDLTPDCAEDAHLCDDQEYYAIMTEECPKTCGRCPSTPAGSCQDQTNPGTGVSDCSHDKHLCDDPQYYALMTRQCPKTCGRC